MLEVYYKKDDVLKLISSEIDRLCELRKKTDYEKRQDIEDITAYSAFALTELMLNITHADILKEHIIGVIADILKEHIIEVINE
jgi:uncharacterized protein (UPF0332 family)